MPKICGSSRVHCSIIMCKLSDNNAYERDFHEEQQKYMDPSIDTNELVKFLYISKFHINNGEYVKIISKRKLKSRSILMSS